MEAALQRALDTARTNLPAAIGSVRRYLAIKPASLDGLNVMGLLLTQAGQPDQAAVYTGRAVELAPSPQAHNNHASVLLQLRRFSESAGHAAKAVELNPKYALGYLTLSCALNQVPDARGAIEAARRGLELVPGSPQHSRNLVLALDQAGQMEEAVRIAEETHRAHPDSADVHSLLLMMLNYTEMAAADLAGHHRRFGELHPSAPAAAPEDPDPDRPLRIGVLSADLRTHSVGFFVEPILEGAPAWARLTCFSASPALDDPMARRFRSLVKAWEEVGHLDEAALASTIRRARIDILLELGGHSGGSRISALARKPAPIIVTAIGYPNTTGLGAVDYRVVDSITDPPGSESLATERLLRIDPCFLCYRPPGDLPDPAMPAVDGPITFGSFNAPAKIGRLTAEVWAGTLAAVPGSRLVLKSKDLAEASAQEALLERLGGAGIGRERVSIIPATASIREHLGLYGQVHIALDTFPYNGTTTTCEALVMGVPVVTLEGDRHAARVGASLLAAVGRPEWVARSPEEFARIAAKQAADRAGLLALRAGLRGSVMGSVLCDAPAYSARVFGALRECWRRLCAEHRS